MAFVLPATLSTGGRAGAPPRVCASADAPPPGGAPALSRRAALAAAAAAVAAVVAGPAAPRPASAEVEYAGVPFLGGSEIVDINNANVRAYMKYPGMYPTLAGMIAKHGPYAKASDVMDIPGLTEQQKEILKKYEDKMVVLRPTPEYELDKINNVCIVSQCA